MMVSVPSIVEKNASPVAGSKAAPSTPCPMGSVATTVPAPMSETAATPLRQPLNRRPCATSIGIAAPRLVDECDAMRAVDARDLAEQLPIALVDDDHTILACDEQAVVRGIRDDVVPASLATELVRVAHGILCGCRLGETDRNDH